MRVLLLDKVHELFKEQFLKWDWQVEQGYDWTYERLIQEISSFDGLVLRSRFILDGDLLSKASKLKFVARPGAGLENIDLEYCNSNNIKVFRSPEGNRDAVAEHIIGMLLALLTNLVKADKEVRLGLWNRETNRGYELKGRTVGIIGYGFMGKCFAEKLSGFGVDVLAYDKYKSNFTDNVAKEVSLEEIFEKTDVLSLHTPLTNETIGMVDFEFLKKFKKPIILINSARGKSVILTDLLLALNSGIVLGACLDVLELENHSFESLDTSTNKAISNLIKNENVLFTPHIAGWTHEAKIKMAQVVLGKVEQCFLSNNCS